MSWQQALLDKGCEHKSQGTKEEKVVKTPAPAPRRDREAQEAGGAMNVEKTGNSPGTALAKAGTGGAFGLSSHAVLTWRWPS